MAGLWCGRGLASSGAGRWMVTALALGVVMWGAIAVKSAPRTAARRSAPQATPRPPAVQPVNAAALRRLLAARRGQVVVVNFWATWCPPCVAELPALAQIRRRYTARGLSLLLVSADEAKDRSRLPAFLSARGITFPTFAVAGNPYHFIEEFLPGQTKAFALPRSFIYNRQGKLVHDFAEELTAAEWERLVRPLVLAKNGRR